MKINGQLEILKESNELLLHSGSKVFRIKLENQLMQILMVLLDNRNQLVEKKVFIDNIWDGNEFSGDGALTRNIFKLRALLKDNGLEDTLNIETIPKKGYRLLINIETGKPAGYRVSRRAVFGGAVMAIIVIILLFVLKKPVDTAGPVSTIIPGEDSIIQLGGNKVRVIDLDTLRAPVILQK